MDVERGRLLLAAGRYRQALEAARAALVDDPHDDDALLLLARANLRLGDFHEALRAAEAVSGGAQSCRRPRRARPLARRSGTSSPGPGRRARGDPRRAGVGGCAHRRGRGGPLVPPSPADGLGRRGPRVPARPGRRRRARHDGIGGPDASPVRRRRARLPGGAAARPVPRRCPARPGGGPDRAGRVRARRGQLRGGPADRSVGVGVPDQPARAGAAVGAAHPHRHLVHVPDAGRAVRRCPAVVLAAGAGHGCGRRGAGRGGPVAP